jgi:hemoglobin/transferrin/lactoferrin receptor protein
MECTDRLRQKLIKNNWSPASGVVMFLIFGLFNNAAYAVDGLNQTAEESKANENDQTTQKKKVIAENVDTLPEVSVKDVRVKEESGINPTQSITTITTEQLQRSQFSNIFDAVRSVPGVSTTGGPRASGMTFSIRGYSDTEDVMVKVDGAPKGFEKYRMGGTFIEPELLKSIEVQRGPQIASGSGSLGGTIVAETKNAADFLKPGQKVGAKAKFGYGNNNDEYTRSYMLYARPDERIDILYNYSNRQSNDITLADGTKLDSSAIQSISQLLKISIFPTEDLELATSLVKFDDTGLQPYDATGGQPGSFGNVIRTIDDFSWTETLKYTPDNPWINFKAVVAGGHTNLQDLIPPGFSSFNQQFSFCRGTVYIPNPTNTTRCAGNLTDYYTYKTKTIDLSNTSVFLKTANTEVSLLTGWQYNDRERDVLRFYENSNYILQSQYPNGLNYAAPPGDRSYKAFYLQPNFQLGQLNIKPGYRRDDYKIIATRGMREYLDSFDEEHKIQFTEETVSLGLAYDLFPRNNLEQLTIYSNYGQGFRPPLMDQFFAPFGFTPGAKCGPAVTSTDSATCGDVYSSQRSESTEAGVSYQNARFLGTDAFFNTKLNFYHIYTSKLLTSFALDEATGKYEQNGWERRNGVEFESFLQYHSWFMRASYSKIRGEIFNGVNYDPLYTAPGNALNINIGTEIIKSVDINLTYRKISDRNVITSGDGVSTPFEFGTQAGYELWNAGLHWQVNPNFGMRVIGENLTNNQYRLDSAMGGLGILGPGRNLKFFAEMMY